MVDTTIVALPSVDDKVNRISSEDAAHLTIVYLGDLTPEQAATVVEFTEHAAAQLSPFGASVDYRGKLGPKDADVLFFKPSKWDLARVEEFRHWLLSNDTIKTAYDSVPQFPEWTPHLTLGYPESPAHEDDSDYPGINYVNFDRIAVWIGDSEGPEFRLQYDDYGMDGVAAMSDVTTTERGEAAVREIFHFGVKGMKWGVRNDGQRGAVRRGATKAKAALDAGSTVIREGEKKLVFLPMAHRRTAASRTQTRVLSTARKINKSPQFKGKDLKGNTRLRNAYMKKVEDAAKKIYAEELDISRTEAWGEALGVDTSSITNTMRFTAARDRVQHADEDDREVLLELKLTMDDLGQISGVQALEKYLKHFNFDDDFFEHYGVKGMRWGVTNNADGTTSVNQTRVRKSLRSSDKAVTVTQRKPGQYVKAKGGTRQTASTDAVKTQAARQKAKKSTTDSLSNKQLKDAVERMRLEQEFAKLDKKVSRKGQSFVSRLLAGAAAAGQAAGQTKTS